MLLERLGVERLGLVTHNSNLASLLVKRAIQNCLREKAENIGIIELTPINKNAIYDVLDAAGGRAGLFLMKDILEARNFSGRLFLISIGGPLDFSLQNLWSLRTSLYLFISDKSLLMRKLGLETWRIMTMEPGSFIAKGAGQSFKIIVRDNDLAEEDVLNNYLYRAYSIIVDSMSEYGEISVKDALNILAASLGITKEKARETIGELIQHKKIKVVKGKIELY